MTRRRLALAAAALLLVAAGLWLMGRHARGPVKEPSRETPLFTGKEPKLKISLNFPSSAKAGFSVESAEIYQTASKSAQLKQALLRLFSGPQAPGALAMAPSGFRYREAFVLDSGLAVVDLDGSSVAALPGGTSSEFILVYCLARCALDNFKEIKKVQILVDGNYAESLAGHMDVSAPLSMEDF